MKLALSGKMGSGKDFLAQKIIEQYEYAHHPFKRLAFADILKGMVEEIFNVRKGEHPKAREILQLFGHVGRLANPLYWVEPIIEEADNCFENVIVTDMRFKNEANELAKQGFRLIRVEASRKARAGRVELGSEDDISETDLDEFTFDADFDSEDDYKVNPEAYDVKVNRLMNYLVTLEAQDSLVMK